MKTAIRSVVPILLAMGSLALPAVAQCPPHYTVTTSPAGITSIAGMPGEVVLATNATLPGGAPGLCAFGCVGTATAIFDDDYFGPISIPFPFYYFGALATDVYVDSNGFLQVGLAPPPCATFTNLAIGAAGAEGRIAPFWDDLRGQSTLPTCTISYEVTGLPGARSMTFQWTDLQTWTGSTAGGPCSDNGMRMTFQTVLREASNDIEFKYATLVPGAPAPLGTVGVSDVVGGTGVSVPFNMSGASSAFPTVNYLADACTACASARKFGDPCPATITTSGGAPTSPNPSFAIGQSGAAPTVPAFLLIGLSNTSWVGLPLPLPLSTFGITGGCHLLASIDIVFVGATSGSGTSSVGVPIPPGLAACGGTVYVQWANITAGGPIAVQATDGLIVTFG